jgi:hypothetical protein
VARVVLPRLSQARRRSSCSATACSRIKGKTMWALPCPFEFARLDIRVDATDLQAALDQTRDPCTP